MFHTNAQDSIRQFPNSDEKPLWVTKTTLNFNPDVVCEYNYMGMMGDTLINSKQYKKIYYLSDSIVEPEYISSLHAALREELGKVYIIYYNNGFNEWSDEFLLFDYSLSIGDPVTDGITIAAIDVLTLNGGLPFMCYSFENGMPDEKWIEGIGSSHLDIFGFDYESELYPDEGCFSINTTLSCFKLDNMLIYGDDCGGEDVSSLNVVEPKQVSAIEFYPNPVNDYLYFKFNHLLEGETCEIKIIDLSGKLVYEDVLSSGNNAISLNHFNSGMYILKIVFKDSTFNEVLVIDNN